MFSLIRIFEKIIIIILLIMMMVAIFTATIELSIILYTELQKPPFLLLNIEEMLEVFGFFLMVLIGMELLETIKAYLEKDKIHIEVVFLVALIAITRKIVILDFKTYTPLTILSMASLVLALSAGFFLVKHGLRLSQKPPDKKDPDEISPEGRRY